MAAPKDEKQIITAFTLDFETGGLDCQNSACTQIALHAIRLDTFECMDKLVLYIYPYKKQEGKGKAKRKVLKNKFETEDEGESMEYGDKALTYSAITMEMLHNMGVDIKDVASQVIVFIKKNTLSTSKNLKPFLIGQNVLFDTGFLQQLLVYGEQWGEFVKLMRGVKDFWGNFQPYYQDTIILGQFALSHLDGVESYKLEIISEKLGIELDDAHDADADVAATTNIVAVLTTRMRSVGGNIEGGDLAIQKGEKTRTHFKI